MDRSNRRRSPARKIADALNLKTGKFLGFDPQEWGLVGRLYEMEFRYVTP